MKKFIVCTIMMVMMCGEVIAANNNAAAVEVAKCPVYPCSVLSKEYINGGKDVRLKYVLNGGAVVRVTVTAKDYMRFILKEASYDLVMLSDRSVVMRPTLRRQPR